MHFFVYTYNNVEINDELLKSLREQVEAQLATEGAVKRQADETMRLRRAEQAKLAILTDIVERYAKLGEQVAGLINITMSQQVSLSGMVESLDEIRYKVEQNGKLIWILIGTLAPKRGMEKITEAAEAIEQEISLKRQLTSLNRNLNEWKERAAVYGVIDAPVSLLRQIEMTEDEIKRIEQQLADRQEQ